MTKSKHKFYLGLVLPSARYTQCQVTLQNRLRKSSNSNVRGINKSTVPVNFQYDKFGTKRKRWTCSSNEGSLIKNLKTQSLIIKSTREHLDSKFINR